MDKFHSESSFAFCQWRDILAMGLAVALFIPVSIELSIGQDGATRILVQRPDAGTAPAPRVNSEVVSDAEINALEELSSNQTHPKHSNAPEIVHTLSVKPGASALLPADRPAWIGASPDFSGKVHRLFVGSLPTASPSNADRSLDEPLIAAVNEYIDQEVLHQPNAADELKLDEHYIRKNLINDPEGFSMELTTSQGPMYQKWVTVEITPEQRQQIQVWHREVVQRNRLGPLGLGLAAIVGLVGASHLVLRRRHGAPGIQPLSADERFVSLQATPPRKAGLSLFAILFCVLILPAMLGAIGLVSTVIFYARQSVQEETVSAQVEQSVRAEIKELENRSSSVGLRKSETEQKIESNGQVIIIRKSNL